MKIGDLTFKAPCEQAVVTVLNDGTVIFGDHLTPQEGSEEAWNLLLKLAADHNSKIPQSLEAMAKKAYSVARLLMGSLIVELTLSDTPVYRLAVDVLVEAGEIPQELREEIVVRLHEFPTII